MKFIGHVVLLEERFAQIHKWPYFTGAYHSILEQLKEFFLQVFSKVKCCWIRLDMRGHRTYWWSFCRGNVTLAKRQYFWYPFFRGMDFWKCLSEEKCWICEFSFPRTCRNQTIFVQVPFTFTLLPNRTRFRFSCSVYILDWQFHLSDFENRLTFIGEFLSESEDLGCFIQVDWRPWVMAW